MRRGSALSGDVHQRFGNGHELSDLGLLGASPLLMFSVAILTGLFSNRVFDWLRSVADSTTASARTTTTATTTDTTPLPAEDGDANR